MNRITIDRKALKAVSYMMAKKDVRYYLNGVYVEYSPLETRLIATNGHMLAVHRSDAENEGSGSFIIPDSTVASMLRWKGVSKHNATPITITVDNGAHTASFHGESIVFTPIDGKFPDWRRVIPTGPFNGIASQLNARYVYAMHRAGDALYDDPKRLSRVSITHNGAVPDEKDASGEVLRKGHGPTAALVSVNGDPDFIGVIMPMVGEPLNAPPEWFKASE